MAINLLGQHNILGMGVLYTNFSGCLKKFPHLKSIINEVDVTNTNSMDEFVRLSQEDDINIWFLPSPYFGRPNGKNVVWAFFESTVLPEIFINYYNSADLVWAPSDWAKGVLYSNGVDLSHIDIVPAGVCPSTFNPFQREKQNAVDSKIFRFLAVGKYEERKGYKQLFEAFKLAFENDSAVELIVKADCFADLDAKRKELVDNIAELNITNINITYGAFSNEDMVALYNYADAFVYPTRAEGWGLPLIEAIASGLPVIATNYSGQTEFLSKIDGYYLSPEYRLVSIGSEFKKLWSINDNASAVWAQVDPEDLALKMRMIVADCEAWSKRAIYASDVVRTYFTWQRAVDAGVSSLRRHFE